MSLIDFKNGEFEKNKKRLTAIENKKINSNCKKKKKKD